MSALGFSFIDSNESKNIEQSTTKKHCRTLRKRHKKKSSKIDNLLNSLSATQPQVKEGLYGGDRDVPSRRECDDECLADFNPLPQSEKFVSKDSYQDMDSNKLMPDNIQEDTVEEDDDGENGQFGGVNKENFAQLGEVTSDDYYKQYVPYYSQLQGSPEQRYILIKMH